MTDEYAAAGVQPGRGSSTGAGSTLQRQPTARRVRAMQAEVAKHAQVHADSIHGLVGTWKVHLGQPTAWWVNQQLMKHLPSKVKGTPSTRVAEGSRLDISLWVAVVTVLFLSAHIAGVSCSCNTGCFSTLCYAQHYCRILLLWCLQGCSCVGCSARGTTRSAGSSKRQQQQWRQQQQQQPCRARH
jgi:hypothetical protein